MRILLQSLANSQRDGYYVRLEYLEMKVRDLAGSLEYLVAENNSATKLVTLLVILALPSPFLPITRSATGKRWRIVVCTLPRELTPCRFGTLVTGSIGGEKRLEGDGNHVKIVDYVITRPIGQDRKAVGVIAGTRRNAVPHAAFREAELGQGTWGV